MNKNAKRSDTITVSFNKNQMYYKEKFENLAIEFNVTIQELLKLAMIKFINKELSYANINELEMFSNNKRIEHINKYNNNSKFTCNEY